MHCGQIGFLQTAQDSVARTPRCFWQYREVGAASAASGFFSSCEIRRRETGAGAAGGGGVCGRGGGSTGAGAPNSRRTSSFTNSDESSPQVGQMNFTGFCAISGVRSKAYFAPQGHCSFMGQGLGFNSTTPGVSASENVSCGPLACTLPSAIKKLPPYLLWLLPGGLPLSEKMTSPARFGSVFT